MKEIVLICQAGVSTNLIKEKINEYTETENLKLSITAIPVHQLKNMINNGNIDIFLFTPQLKFLYKSYLKEYGENKKIEIIDMENFQNLNIGKILQNVIDNE